ncbi:integrator complex assembly factor WDR73-like [Crassostrea virginica]
MTSCEFDGDDWFYDSISRYKHLYMYDLQYPVTAFDWINNNFVCVATRGRPKHEITELSLPDKLCTSEELALSKNRDFQVVTGGFSSSEIRVLKHIPETRLICTSSVKNQDSIDIWRLGAHDTDLIETDGKIHSRKQKGTWSSIAAMDKNHVIFGSHGDNLCFADVITQNILLDTTELPFTCTSRISRISTLDNHTVCCCFTNGNLLMWDTREKTPTVHEINFERSNAHWTMDLCDTDLVQLSSGGDVLFLDTRKLKNVTSTNNIGLTTKDTDCLRVCLKLHKGNCLLYSVSGFDGNVYLYAVTSPSAEFVHEGHCKNCSVDLDPSNLNVVTHSWHPMENVILSAASDGSLHAWQPTSIL